MAETRRAGFGKCVIEQRRVLTENEDQALVAFRHSGDPCSQRLRRDEFRVRDEERQSVIIQRSRRLRGDLLDADPQRSSASEAQRTNDRVEEATQSMRIYILRGFWALWALV